MPFPVFIIKPLTSLAGWILQALSGQRRVECTVHKAVLADVPQVECAFIKIINKSSNKEIEVSHVWFDTQPRVDVITRLLPKRLKPDETWETWTEVTQIPEQERADFFGKVRVRLSTGKVIYSKEGKDIPPMGYVAGT